MSVPYRTGVITETGASSSMANGMMQCPNCGGSGSPKSCSHGQMGAHNDRDGDDIRICNGGTYNCTECGGHGTVPTPPPLPDQS